MKKQWFVVAMTVLLMAGNANAGFKDKIGELLGIESAPAPSRALGMAAAPETVPQHLALWLLGTPTEIDNPDAEFSARLGWRNDDTEFGGQFDAIGIHGENYESFGIYGLLWLTDTEYTGYAGSIVSENISYGPFAGTVLAGVILEYRYRDYAGESRQDNAKDRHQVYAGVRLKF